MLSVIFLAVSHSAVPVPPVVLPTVQPCLTMLPPRHALLTAIPAAADADAFDDFSGLLYDASDSDDNDDDDAESTATSACATAGTAYLEVPTSRPNVSRDPLTSLEHLTIDEFMFRDLQDAIALEILSFPVM